MKFKKNIGPMNRIARLVVGLILITLFVYYYPNNMSLVGIILGIILLAEALFSYCIIHGIRETKDMR